MKGYFISTTALICLLMLSMYAPIRNLSLEGSSLKKEVQQDQNKHFSSVNALEYEAAQECVPVESVTAFRSPEYSKFQRQVTAKFKNLFFEPFGNTDLACDQISFVENKLIFWDAKPGGL